MFIISNYSLIDLFLSVVKSYFRHRASESVQFFQFDEQGNMFVFAPGAGCSSEAQLVKPGDELIFTGSNNISQDSSNCVSETSVKSDASEPHAEISSSQ